MISSSNPVYGPEEKEAVTEVLERGYTAEGPEAKKLKEQLSDRMNRGGSIVTTSGTTALFLLLRAMDTGGRNEVIIPSYTCQALLNSIYQAGYDPVPVDVSSDSLSLDRSAVDGRLNSETAAIIVVHNFGYPVEEPELFQLDIPIIEDVATAIGGTYFSDQPVGSKGYASIGSLYATKPVSAGTGGFVATDDEILLREMKNLKKYDEREEYELSYNLSLSDLLASVANVQLEKLENKVDQRRNIARRYNRNFEKLDSLKLPAHKEGHTYYRYVIKTEKSDQLQKYLQDYEIEAKRPVYRPLHDLLDLASSNYPVSERLHREALLIPLYFDLSEQEIEKIIKTVTNWFNS